MRLEEKVAVLLLLLGGAAAVGFLMLRGGDSKTSNPTVQVPYQPRVPIDTSGFLLVRVSVPPWKEPASLEEIRDAFSQITTRVNNRLDEAVVRSGGSEDMQIEVLLNKASLFMYDGEAKKAYDLLTQTRLRLTSAPELAARWLYTTIFFQGVASLRRGEDENCVDCRGEGACILPLRRTAIHVNPAGSTQAVAHFTEYLQQFPDDIGVHWLLNLAYMTLGEHPQKVPPQYLLAIDRFGAEFDIGRFQDVAPLVGLDRFNQAGGAIMDDFDNDGLLDVVVTSWDPAQAMAFYRNMGDGTFEDRTAAAGLTRQLGGLNLVQTDYNNDGFLDIFIARGAWYLQPMRPTLLRNNGNGTFTDVTREAGLMDPVNSNCAAWADFDNDGFLDVYVCNETGANRLYRNRGNGTFEEIAARAGVQGKQKMCKGATWIDYDNDGYPDLFVNYFESTPQLFHNNRDGTFTDVTEAMGITGPFGGFSCWAFDYDNDGWLDIFATCYQRDLNSLVHGLQGRPGDGQMDVTRLYRNVRGKRFQDVSKAAGVDRVFATMGSNFADFDNDGYLDFYLGTGEPDIATLIPNRMFKNVPLSQPLSADGQQQPGRRFAEITATAGTGHLQKGHGVACGDWNRDGSVDLFVEVGGAVPGDRFRNALFQNPGQGNNWLTVRLVGSKTNRAAIGARIKAVTAGAAPLTVHRHVTSGSSFGANPLQQILGLGKGTSVAILEIHWPTSGTTQVFHDIAVNQAIEITEFATAYRKLNWPRIPLPRE